MSSQKAINGTALLLKPRALPGHLSWTQKLTPCTPSYQHTLALFINLYHMCMSQSFLTSLFSQGPRMVWTSKSPSVGSDIRVGTKFSVHVSLKLHILYICNWYLKENIWNNCFPTNFKLHSCFSHLYSGIKSDTFSTDNIVNAMEFKYIVQEVPIWKHTQNAKYSNSLSMYKINKKIKYIAEKLKD